MSLKVVIPTPLRKHTGGLEVIEVDAGTVKEVIDRKARSPESETVFATIPEDCAASLMFMWMGKTSGFCRTSARPQRTDPRLPSFRQSLAGHERP